jgi:hypothetical protein
MNKVLLQKYKNYNEIWKDLGKAISNILTIFSESATDPNIIAQTIREAALLLYLQWHHLSKRRYQLRRSEESAELGKDEEEKIYVIIEGQTLELEEHFCQDNLLTSVTAESLSSE